MLLLSLTITCPTCGSRVASDARSCMHCDKRKRDRLGPPLRPLIMPGAIDLSDDQPVGARRERLLVAVTLAMSMLVAVTLVSARVADDKAVAHQLTSLLPDVPTPDSGSIVWATLRPLAAQSSGSSVSAVRTSSQRNTVASAVRNAALTPRATPEPLSRADDAAQRAANAMAGSSRSWAILAASPRSVSPRAASSTAASSTSASSTSESSTSASPSVAATHSLRAASSHAVSLRAESADVPLSLAVPVTAQLGNAGHAISARAVAAPPIRRDSIFAELPNRLDATDVHTALVSFVSALPERTAMNADLMAFYAGGGRHRVQMLEETSTAATAQSSLRVSFAIQLSKVDGLGREQKRILPVSMIVAKRDGDVNASAVTFGALRRP